MKSAVEPETQTPIIDFKQLVASDRRARELARTQSLAAAKRMRPMRETREAIAEAAWGPIDPATHQPTMVMSKVCASEWAPFIARAARAWKCHPGPEVIRREPRLREGAGMEAARLIFLCAMDRGLDAGAIQALLEEAMAQLGPVVLCEELQDSSSMGLINFFQQLARFYDGTRWAPPTNWDTSVEKQLSWKSTRGASARSSLPSPALEQVQSAIATIEKSTLPIRYSVAEVMTLYALGEVSEREFKRSRQYLDLEQEHKAHRLPKPQPIPDVVGDAGKSHRGWHRGEVLAALRGWEKKLSGGSTPF